MSILLATPAQVNAPLELAPVFTSTGCLRSVPCESANFTYASERCTVCFTKWIAQFDHYKVAEDDVIFDEPRPTAEESYIPSDEDEAARLEWVAELDARDELMGEWAAADRLEDMTAAFDPWDLLNPAEIVEFCGSHPSNGYEI